MPRKKDGSRSDDPPIETIVETIIEGKIRLLTILASVAITVSLGGLGFLYTEVYSLNRQLGETSSSLKGDIAVVTTKLENAAKEIDNLRSDIRQLDVPRIPVLPDTTKGR